MTGAEAVQTLINLENIIPFKILVIFFCLLDGLCCFLRRNHQTFRKGVSALLVKKMVDRGRRI